MSVKAAQQKLRWRKRRLEERTSARRRLNSSEEIYIAEGRET